MNEEKKQHLEHLKKKLESTIDAQERRELMKRILDLKIEIVDELRSAIQP